VSRLFDEPEADAPTQNGRVVGIVVNANVWQSFDYLWPDALGEPFPGQRVRVPFGRSSRKTLGFVVETLRRPGRRELKPVAEVIDPQPQFDETLWQLGQWISEYYLTPLGMTLAAMVPSAVGRHRPKTETVAYLAKDRHDWPARLGAKQRRLLDELYEARKQGIEPLVLEEMLRHAGASRDTVRRLRQRELIRLEERPVRLPELSDQAGGDPFDLNDEQRAVLASLEPKLAGGFSATLLHGVTGSGKTEVYVRAIRRVVEAGRQAILLVPEIALATQTLQRLLGRLPRVAVLHSGLTDAQRAFYYDQIRDGHAAVVVGPRSAVFAPARKLGLVVVDEEHESSYKQETAPRYHGRDVAVKRAQLAGVPVVLGSATPSLESFHNARLGRYALLRLPHRVKGLPMPTLRIVHLRKDMGPGVLELLGRTLTLRMAAALDRGEQIILLMNRRGYASYVFCPKCHWMMSCPNCARAMVFHQATDLVMCHYCQESAALPTVCPACGGKLLLFGFGIQRIENELSRKFPQTNVARMDSDTMTSPKQFRQVFDAFAAGDIDILLGTQMVGKGLDFPRISVVGVASADTSLAINDFRAAERTFQLVVQVAGRAGRGGTAGEVVVQTLHEDEPAIRFAARHDYDGFAAHELPLRKEAGLPPFARMIRFVVSHADADRAETAARKLAAALRPKLQTIRCRLFGPGPAPVRRIRGNFRWELTLLTERGGVVQPVLGRQMADLTRGLGADIAADVDPINLL